MQIAAEQLPAQLQRGLHTLYTIHGNEPLLVQEALDAIRTAARQQGFAERSSHTVSGAHFDWSAVQAACNSLSLFSARQIVEIHIPTGKPGKDGPAVLQQLAQESRANPDTLLLVTLPRLDKATKSSAWFAALEQCGASIAINAVERPALPRWIAQRLQQQGQRVSSGQEGEQALRFFADRVEGNLLAAHQEIQKLALLYPEGELAAAQMKPPCSMWRGMTYSSWARQCSQASCYARNACSTACRPRAKAKSWCITRWLKIYAL